MVSPLPLLLSGSVWVDWAGGRIWVRTAPATDIRSKIAGLDGHATLVLGTMQPRFHPETDALSSMARALRQKYDPKGILNPGLMG